MTEQEFLQLKRQATGGTYTIYQKMLHHKDKEICYTKKYAPLWIYASIKRAQKSIYATVPLDHLCVYAKLMPQLMNPDIDVKLLIEKWPSDMNGIMMVSMLMRNGRAKICRSDEKLPEYVCVDTHTFLVQRDPQYYWLCANNFTVSKKLNEIILEKWAKPTHISSHICFNPFDYQKTHQKSDD